MSVFNFPNKTKKVFTIDRNGITEGARCQKFELKTGVIIDAILLGEKGEGRDLGVVPVNKLPEETTLVKYAEKSEKKSSLFYKTEEQYISSEDKESAFVFVLPSLSPKQFVEITSGMMDNRGVYKRLSCPIYSSGKVAVGEAGRNGWGHQIFLELPTGYILRVARYGKIKPEEDEELFYMFDGKQLLCSRNIKNFV
jgi:hypothetical protein